MPTLVFHLDDGSVLTHTLDEGTTTLGRHPDSVVVLEFPSVSAHHAVIELGESGCYVSDLKSSNGTRVNGVVIEEARLNEGDRVAFGDVQCVYYEGEPPDHAEEPPQADPDAVETIYVPPPEVHPVEPTFPAPPARARAAQPPPPRRRPYVRVTSYPDTSGSGCGTAVIVIGLFLGAMLLGLFLRHHKETEGGNFFSDLAGKMFGNIPKIRIEKKVEE